MNKADEMINATQSSNSSEHNSSSKFEKISDFGIGLDYENRLHYVIAFCTVNVIFCITASFGNIAILLTLWRTPSLHSAANILLASLAVSDLFVGLLIEPFYITLVLTNPPSHSPTLIVFEFLNILLCGASFTTTAAIGIDRLLAIQLHLRYKAVVTPLRVTWAVIAIWIISGILSCTRLWTTTRFYLTLSSITFASLAVSFVVYLKIYLIVRRHRLQIAHQQQQQQPQQQRLSEENIFRKIRKSAVNTFLVCILLICCYMPHSILLMNNVFQPNILGITFMILLLNSSLNPMLFCWRIREIGTAMKYTFRCCF